MNDALLVETEIRVGWGVDVAATDPAIGGAPYLVMKQPLSGPWQDRVGEEHAAVPLLGARQVEAQPVAGVDVRQAFEVVSGGKLGHHAAELCVKIDL